MWIEVGTVSVSKDVSIIYVTETYDREKEYGLEEIADMFATEMRGWGPCSVQLYGAIEMAKCDVEDEYKNMSKGEYI